MNNDFKVLLNALNGCVSVCPVPGTISLRIPLPVQLVFKPEVDPI
jgi:hypothetical protein